MDRIVELLSGIYGTFGPGMFFPIAILGAAAVLGQWTLYQKCGLPGVASVVPVWNVLVFLKIMGRPAWQGWLLMAPPPIILALLIWNPFPLMVDLIIAGVIGVAFIYFMVVLYIELCNCFGKYKMVHYIMCIMLNGLYVLHLGLSNEEEYKGPVHHLDADQKPGNPALA